jgi:hypothetical protein
MSTPGFSLRGAYSGGVGHLRLSLLTQVLPSRLLAKDGLRMANKSNPAPFSLTKENARLQLALQAGMRTT